MADQNPIQDQDDQQATGQAADPVQDDQNQATNDDALFSDDDFSDDDFSDDTAVGDDDFTDEDDLMDEEDLFDEEELSDADFLGDELGDDDFTGDDSQLCDDVDPAEITAAQEQADQEATQAQAAMMAQLPGADKFDISPAVMQQHGELVKLVLATESMNDEEREYWFQILPIMTDEQVQNLRDILVNEKQQLAQLDQEYEQELNRLNEKHMVEWKEFEAKEKRRSLEAAEQAEEEKESAAEEELLKQLEEL